MTCFVHSPSAGDARFTGRTDPLSRGADYISSASYARRGQLVTTDGDASIGAYGVLAQRWGNVNASAEAARGHRCRSY